MRLWWLLAIVVSVQLPVRTASRATYRFVRA